MSHEDLISGKLAEHLRDFRESLDFVGRQLRDALAAIPKPPDESELARLIGEAIPAPEPPPPPEPPRAVVPPSINNTLLYRMASLEYAKSQTEILDMLLQGLGDFAQRVALLVVREEAVQGWNGIGFGDSVKTWKSSLSEDPLLRTVSSTRSRMLLDGAVPGFVPPAQVQRSMITPLLLKGKVSAFVYADSGDGGKLDHYSIDALVRTASLVIDIFPLHQKREPLPPVLENQGIIVPGPVAASEQAPSGEDSVLFEDSGTLGAAQEDEGPANQTIVADIPREVAAAPPAQEIQGESYEVAEVVEEIRHPEPLEAAPPLESTSPGIVQEEPIPPCEEKMHEDAQRFSRLLVQEIALYHPREVEQGKRGKNLYSLLKDDIDRSQEAYNHRFSKASVQSRKYFEKALAKNLADGDASLLGM